MQIPHEQIKPRYQWVLAAVGLLVLVVVIWLPTGFNVSGWGDEWKQMVLMDSGPFVIGLDIRPLIQVSWWLAHLLTPNSFLGMNLLFMLALFGKGFGLYALLTRLKASPAVAFAAAALFVVYPSDIVAFTLAVLNIQLSAAFFLLAAYSLVVYWQKPGILPIIGIEVGLFFALGIVEISLPLMVFFPLILIFMERGFRKRMLLAAGLWYAVPALYGLRAAVLALQGNSVLGYQASKLAGDNGLLVMIGSVINTYIVQVFNVWLNSVGFTVQSFSDPVFWLSVITLLIVAVFAWLFARQDKPLESTQGYGALFVIGFMALGLGFAPFILSNFRDSNSRTTLFSSGGAAIMVAVFIFTVARLSWKIRFPFALAIALAFIPFYRSQPAPIRYSGILIVILVIGLVLPRLSWRSIVMIVPFIGMGLGYSIFQHLAFHKDAQLQAATLKQLVEAAPQIQPDTTILLLGDKEMSLYPQFALRSDIFESALRFLYSDQNQSAYLCGNGQPNGGDVYLASCQFDADAVKVMFRPPFVTLDYNKIIVFQYTVDGKVTLLTTLPPDLVTSSINTKAYAPLQHIVAEAPLPERLKTLFER